MDMPDITNEVLRRFDNAAPLIEDRGIRTYAWTEHAKDFARLLWKNADRSPDGSIQLLREARDFVGKSRCSVGHSINEVQDRSKAGTCVYCVHQFGLYESLTQAVDEAAKLGRVGCTIGKEK